VAQKLDQEQMMFRYLLEADKLPAQEVERFEDEYFGDDETFALLLAAEDELIDRYLRGELGARDREGFEGHFLRSTRRRQKVENAKAMRRVIPELAASKRPGPEPGSTRQSFVSMISFRLYGQKFLSGAALAMAALLIVVAGMSVLRIRRSNQAVEQARKEQAVLERQVADARKESGLLAERLQRANDQLANLAGGQDESPASSAPIARFSLNLDTGSRSGGETMKLVIPSKVDVARLRILLSTSEYGNYQAELKPVGSDVSLWSQRRIQALRTKSGEAMIDLWLPAGLLTRGEYILELSGIKSHGLPERLPPYAFIVERK
jgi:hypothetical protein